MAGYSGTPLPQKLGIKPGSRLALVHPVLGREMSWDSPPPPDFEHLCAVLREELAR